MEGAIREVPWTSLLNYQEKGMLFEAPGGSGGTHPPTSHNPLRGVRSINLEKPRNAKKTCSHLDVRNDRLESFHTNLAANHFWKWISVWVVVRGDCVRGFRPHLSANCSMNFGSLIRRRAMAWATMAVLRPSTPGPSGFTINQGEILDVHSFKWKLSSNVCAQL